MFIFGRDDKCRRIKTFIIEKYRNVSGLMKNASHDNRHQQQIQKSKKETHETYPKQTIDAMQSVLELAHQTYIAVHINHGLMVT